MNILLLNILYWLTSTLELVSMKILSKYYLIDNAVFDLFNIFTTFARSIYLPYYCLKLYQLYKANKKFNPHWVDILTGIFDQTDIFFYYIALSGLSFGEFITYRTCSIFITGISLYMINKNNISIKKWISYIFIFSACITLLIFNNDSKIIYITSCLVSSLIYSCINILIEINVKSKSDIKLNIYWTKLISNVIGGFVGLTYEHNQQLISFVIMSQNGLYITLISLLIGLFANLYYYYKVNIILYYHNKNKNGSIIVMFIDIFRRFAVFLIGMLFFNEIYNNVIYISLTLMFIGTIIGFINFNKCIDNNELLVSIKTNNNNVNNSNFPNDSNNLNDTNDTNDSNDTNDTTKLINNKLNNIIDNHDIKVPIINDNLLHIEINKI